jgi:hypothetical protein
VRLNVSLGGKVRRVGASISGCAAVTAIFIEAGLLQSSLLFGSKDPQTTRVLTIMRTDEY